MSGDSSDNSDAFRAPVVEAATYETPDPPPFVSGPVADDEHSEDVERTRLATDAAFARFKGASLDGAAADFSDDVAKPKRGYRENFERGRDETLADKFGRLQAEISELAAAVAAPEASKDGGVDVAAMAAQVRQLQLQLDSAAGHVFPGLQSEVSRQLLDSLASFKGSAAAAPAQGQAQPRPALAADGGVTYELYYTPAVAALTQASSVADLERRLAAAERALGPDLAKTLAQFGSELQLPGSAASVDSVVAALQQRLAALEGRTIENLLARLKQVAALQKEAATAAGPALNDATTEKISALYSMLSKQDATLAALPDIVARLRALKTVHEQAAGFANSLTQVTSQQEQLVDLIKGQDDVLTQLEASMAENMAAVKANVESLTARMDALMRSQ